MFASAKAAQVFKVHTTHGSLTPSWFIEVRGAVPDWVRACAAPHDGPIPEGRSVHPVDTDAEAREAAAAAVAFQSRNVPALRLADAKKRFGWKDDSQITEAIGRLNFPTGRIRMASVGLYGGEEIQRWQEWDATEVDAWEDAIRRVFPNALPKR